MASQCKRQQCTFDRRGVRQELDSWRHKLIHCVGKNVGRNELWCLQVGFPLRSAAIGVNIHPWLRLGAAKRLFLSSTVSFLRQPAWAAPVVQGCSLWRCLPTSRVSVSFVWTVNAKCKLNSPYVASVAIVGLKGTVFILKGVSQRCVG